MKKTLLFIGAGLLLTGASYAQKSKLERALRGPLTKQQYDLLQNALRIAQPAEGKTTAQTQRLIGYGLNSVSMGGLVDSGRIFYNSPFRGSNHGVNDLSSYSFSYDPTTEYYVPVENLSNFGSLRIKCDSAVLSDMSGIYQRVSLTYNAALQPTSFQNSYFSSGSSDGRERYTMTYNSSGQRTELLYEADTSTSGVPGAFLPDYRMYTAFSTSPARALRDSTVPLPNAPFSGDTVRVLYGYTGANLTSINYQFSNGTTFDTVQRIVMTYDASARVTKADLYLDQGNGLEVFLRDSLTYTGSYPFYTGGYLSINTGTSLQLIQATKFSVNAQGLRDTMRFYDDNNAVVALTAYQYNSYGNPDGYRFFDLTNNPTSPEETGRYYYELYDPTGIADAPASLEATAYPNPVRNSLSLTWRRGDGAVNVQVADASGRVLERVYLPANAGTHNLDMSRYMVGTYFVTLSAASGEMQHLKVTKQ